MECSICCLSFSDIQDTPVSCLDCGKVYCETCYDLKEPFCAKLGGGCFNVIFGGCLVLAPCCENYCHEEDISRCFLCDREVCIKCRDEAEFEEYCYDCIRHCNSCGGDTRYYYGKRYTCANCGDVLCENCLNEEGLCCACSFEEKYPKQYQNEFP